MQLHLHVKIPVNHSVTDLLSSFTSQESPHTRFDHPYTLKCLARKPMLQKLWVLDTSHSGWRVGSALETLNLSEIWIRLIMAEWSFYLSFGYIFIWYSRAFSVPVFDLDIRQIYSKGRRVIWTTVARIEEPNTFPTPAINVQILTRQREAHSVCACSKDVIT